MLWDIERLEIVVDVLDLGAFRDRESGIGEESLDAPHGACHRMQPTGRASPTGQADVDTLAAEACRECIGLEIRAPRLDRGLDRVLDLIDPLTRGRPLVGWQAPQLFQQRGQLATLAEIADPHLIESGEIGRMLDRRECEPLQLSESESGVFGHGVCSLRRIADRAHERETKKGKTWAFPS